MKRASAVRHSGQWNAADEIDRVVLDANERHRRRIVLTGERGTILLLDLPHATALRDGDGLVLDDGTLVRVDGKPEPLFEIAATSANELARLAWHLGNRHTDVQFVGDKLRIRRDHVLEAMLIGLGARLTPMEAPFDPEGGAYELPLIAPQTEIQPSCEARPDSRLPGNEKGGATADGLSQAALYRLMAWLSPAYPVGAFSYSGGIEWAVEAGDIADATTLTQWLAAVIGEGSGFCDAVFLVHAHRAATTGDDGLLAGVAELAAAFTSSKERFLETTAQGRAFFETTRAAWPCPGLDRLAAVWKGPLAYPVAVAVAGAGHGIAVEATLDAFLHALASNAISAGIRLIPLGQTDGQRVLAGLEPMIASCARRALVCALDEVGGAGFRNDIASMRHETQYTRLFRS